MLCRTSICYTQDRRRLHLHLHIYEILGELPAFVVAWGQIFIAMTTSNAAIALTASVYLLQPFGLDCQASIVTCTAIFIISK